MGWGQDCGLYDSIESGEVKPAKLENTKKTFLVLVSLGTTMQTFQ